jgi:hypothetical protein
MLNERESGGRGSGEGDAPAEPRIANDKDRLGGSLALPETALPVAQNRAKLKEPPYTL